MRGETGELRLHCLTRQLHQWGTATHRPTILQRLRAVKLPAAMGQLQILLACLRANENGDDLVRSDQQRTVQVQHKPCPPL